MNRTVKVCFQLMMIVMVCLLAVACSVSDQEVGAHLMRIRGQDLRPVHLLKNPIRLTEPIPLGQALSVLRTIALPMALPVLSVRTQTSDYPLVPMPVLLLGPLW